VAQHLVGSLAAHQQEVCGLKWSPDGKYLASGGNDNLLNVWPVDPGTFYTSATPVYTFNQHQAAVKASFVCYSTSALLAFWYCVQTNDDMIVWFQHLVEQSF